MADALRIGVIGIGRMGLPMSRRWAAAGHSVTGYDPSERAARALADAGARALATPKEVAAASDVIFVLVGYPAQVDACMNGTDGVFAGLQKNAIVVISSTTDPTQVQTLAAAARERDADLIDAPIARAEQAAVSGDLLWFVGGEPTTLARVQGVLAICGKDIHHVGSAGAGQVAKALNNMLLWANVVANREALALAASFGVDEGPLREALLNSSGASWAMAHWQLMENTPWAHKDMVVVSQMADQAGLEMPLAGLLREKVKERWRERGIMMPDPGASRREA